ncbi:MAG: DUF4836 family protein [Prevotella sp.]|nr:DUF4836 family protein [Prevotella sp.]
MKKIAFMMALLAAILLSSCSKQKSAKLVPEDATFVMRFDVMQTTEKCGLKGDNSEMKKWLKEMLSQSEMSKKMRDQVLEIVEDPTKSGIDFTEPIYVYASMSKNGPKDIGFVADMASSGDLTDLLNDIAKESDQDGVEKAKGGASYIELGKEGAIIYTDDWFFAGMTDDVDETVETLTARASGEGSLEGNKAFEAMNSKKGVMQFLMLYAGLSNMPEFKEAKQIMPEGLEIEDMAVVADLELNPGEALMTGEMVALSKELEDYMKETYKVMKPISKEQTKYISDNGLSLFVNLDVTKLFGMYEKLLKKYIENEEELASVKKIVEDFTGTLSLDLYSFDDNGPLLNAYVGTKDTQPLDMVVGSLLADEPLEQVAEKEFTVPYSYDTEWDDDYNMTRTPKAWGLVGFRDGQTFFSTDKEQAFTTPGAAYPTDKIKGKGFYLRFNFQMLNNLKANIEDESAQKVFNEVANTFGEVECYNTDDMKSVFRLTNTDKSKTTIEAIIGLVKKFID